MRRLGRLFLNAATVVSLVLFIGAVRVTKWTHHATKLVYSESTHLLFLPDRGWLTVAIEPPELAGYVVPPAAPPSVIPGVWWRRVSTPAGAIPWVSVHCAWPVSLALLIPAFRLYRALRERQPKPGECRRCAYDLRGNVSGVCPECGAPTRD